MPPIPIVKQTEVRRALERPGFQATHQAGSHVNMARDTLTVIVPQHKGHDMPAGTLRAILEHAGMSVEEFIGWLK